MQAPSLFDPVAFMQQSTTEAATKRPPLPVGDYTATITDVKPRIWQSKDGSKSGIAFDIPLSIEVPADVQASLGLQPNLTLTDSVFVDTNDSGLMDWGPGKNRGLRFYREATGTNVAGQPWSPSKLAGQIVLVKIAHRVIEQGASAGEITEDIKGVAKR
jgi:hypothetical protein